MITKPHAEWEKKNAVYISDRGSSQNMLKKTVFSAADMLSLFFHAFFNMKFNRKLERNTLFIACCFHGSSVSSVV